MQKYLWLLRLLNLKTQSATSLKILSAILELLFELAKLSEDSLIVAGGVFLICGAVGRV